MEKTISIASPKICAYFPIFNQLKPETRSRQPTRTPRRLLPKVYWRAEICWAEAAAVIETEILIAVTLSNHNNFTWYLCKCFLHKFANLLLFAWKIRKNRKIVQTETCTELKSMHFHLNSFHWNVRKDQNRFYFIIDQNILQFALLFN